MPVALEYVVRPFQRQTVSLPTAIESETAQASDVVVHAASRGNVKTFAWSFQASSEGPPGGKYKEVERTTKIVRVENPDDPTQFVNVERAKRITVANEDDPQEKVIWSLMDPV
jgi:hypothetical protein